MELTKADWRAVAERALSQASMLLRVSRSDDEVRNLIARAKSAMEECEKAGD